MESALYPAGPSMISIKWAMLELRSNVMWWSMVAIAVVCCWILLVFVLCNTTRVLFLSFVAFQVVVSESLCYQVLILTYCLLKYKQMTIIRLLLYWGEGIWGEGFCGVGCRLAGLQSRTVMRRIWYGTKSESMRSHFVCGKNGTTYVVPCRLRIILQCLYY